MKRLATSRWFFVCVRMYSKTCINRRAEIQERRLLKSIKTNFRLNFFVLFYWISIVFLSCIIFFNFKWFLVDFKSLRACISTRRFIQVLLYSLSYTNQENSLSKDYVTFLACNVLKGHIIFVYWVHVELQTMLCVWLGVAIVVYGWVFVLFLQSSHNQAKLIHFKQFIHAFISDQLHL